MSAELIKALAVTAELMGTELSKHALVAMEDDLAHFPEHRVLEALVRCRKEITGRLTLAGIIDRIEDGRPKADEAWSLAMKAMDEYETVIMNDEIAEAFGVARPIYMNGDEVGARMAFRSAYDRILQSKKGMPVKWWPSFGEDKNRRESALREAVQLGRLPSRVANEFLPAPIEDVPQLEDKQAVKNVIRIALKSLPVEREGEE